MVAASLVATLKLFRLFVCLFNQSEAKSPLTSTRMLTDNEKLFISSNFYSTLSFVKTQKQMLNSKKIICN